ncbi:hypothetical protein ACFFK7_01830 [Pseudoalteromonas xiamenensis]|uniref:hypothetical protein n=1 Tax=Pseudoalteromonas xiamenensis TaxID=882626 RepID=UPI0035EDCF38
MNSTNTPLNTQRPSASAQGGSEDNWYVLLQSLQNTSSAYQDLLKKGIGALQTKWKANLRVLLIAFCLLCFAVTVGVVLWFCLHALLAYSLVYLGVNWLVSAGLLMTINVFIMYYLISTAMSLFSASARSIFQDDEHINTP